ncbi:hypothetical protein P5673_027260 [Acropora cervicornis]|uniref:Transmembrane protein n=1 Tax=Acropora cervicornis TaxID=6130 RepID=A0AAD9PZ86_ACRCE|nr:hypothetical protein P5673_027260 [Acropora cervicornis]
MQRLHLFQIFNNHFYCNFYGFLALSLNPTPSIVMILIAIIALVVLVVADVAAIIVAIIVPAAAAITAVTVGGDCFEEDDQKGC